MEEYFQKSNVLEARILRYQIFLKVLWESDDKGSCGVWEGSGVSSLTRAKWLQSARKPSIPCERVGGRHDDQEDQDQESLGSEEFKEIRRIRIRMRWI